MYPHSPPPWPSPALSLTAVLANLQQTINQQLKLDDIWFQANHVATITPLHPLFMEAELHNHDPLLHLINSIVDPDTGKTIREFGENGSMKRSPYRHLREGSSWVGNSGERGSTFPPPHFLKKGSHKHKKTA